MSSLIPIYTYIQHQSCYLCTQNKWRIQSLLPLPLLSPSCKPLSILTCFTSIASQLSSQPSPFQSSTPVFVIQSLMAATMTMLKYSSDQSLPFARLDGSQLIQSNSPSSYIMVQEVPDNPHSCPSLISFLYSLHSSYTVLLSLKQARKAPATRTLHKLMPSPGHRWQVFPPMWSPGLFLHLLMSFPKRTFSIKPSSRILSKNFPPYFFSTALFAI